ncbi:MULTISPECIES: flagellar basal body-associated protein FliL [Bacillus]|uniref:flagellar basal body-associated protein FliL n=1 Tax=Bacillus TaxID=1386 RepID=UPI000368BE78|nr:MULTISPECIES: flagellar basal body-associated protein FliL [Bacillus]
MKKNKLLSIMLIMLVSITLVGVIALVIVLKSDGSFAFSNSNDNSIDHIIKASVEVPEITTNLADDGFIKIAFMIQTDSNSAKKELEKRNFQVNNIIISELSELKAEQIQGKQGQEKLQGKLKSRFNSIMQDGKIEKVYITSSIIQ